MRLLVADLHFTDNLADEYRWNIFRNIIDAKPTEVYILGDLCHKKDRHSAVLVNRLIRELFNLTRSGMTVTIICGNHDEPLKGPPYWLFLNAIPRVRFITRPTLLGDIMLLPFSKDPMTEWRKLDLSNCKCIMMHQPVTGADLGNGRLVEVKNMIVFPRHIPVYSGDLHYPQTVDNVTYIGTPYPINFGEHHVYRMLAMADNNYKDYGEILLNPMAKHSVIITSINDLGVYPIHQGDQIKIEFVLPASRIDQWPVEREMIEAWAKENNVTTSVVKATIETSPTASLNGELASQDFLHPIDTLLGFAEAEGIEEALVIAGYNILEGLINAGAGTS